jgi:hypothetical protein
MKIEGKDEGSIHRLDLEGQAKIKRLKSNMTRSGLKKKYPRLNNRLKSDIKRLTRIRMKFNKVKVKAESRKVLLILRHKKINRKVSHFMFMRQFQNLFKGPKAVLAPDRILF